jgi:hypothetical protein
MEKKSSGKKPVVVTTLDFRSDIKLILQSYNQPRDNAEVT